MGTTLEVELDARQRLPMAKIVQGGQHRFRVTHLETGEILLTPVISISERELALLQNPKALTAIRRGIEQAETGEVTHFEAGHFTKLAAGLENYEDD